MTAVCHALQLLCVLALGLFAGAMLTEGLVLVPYWRSLPAQEFFAWYAANDRRLLDFFGPLTGAAALLASAAAMASVWTGHPGRAGSVLAASILVAVVSTFFLYFKRANARFTAASMSPEALPAELERWAAWHRARMALSLVAFAAALLALDLP